MNSADKKKRRLPSLFQRTLATTQHHRLRSSSSHKDNNLSSLFYCLSISITIVLMSLNIYISLHSHQYTVHVENAKEILRRTTLSSKSKEGDGGARRDEATVLAKALEELNKAEAEDQLFSGMPYVLPDAVDFISHLNDSTEHPSYDDVHDVCH